MILMITRQIPIIFVCCEDEKEQFSIAERMIRFKIMAKDDEPWEGYFMRFSPVDCFLNWILKNVLSLFPFPLLLMLECFLTLHIHSHSSTHFEFFPVHLDPRMC